LLCEAGQSGAPWAAKDPAETAHTRTETATDLPHGAARGSAAPVGNALELTPALLITAPPPGVQVVAPDAASTSQTVASGSPVNVTVEYAAADPTLAGLSLRVHLDSTKVTYQGLSNVSNNGFLETPPPTPAELAADVSDL